MTNITSDLIINNVILPDNIDKIKIGDDFEINWEVIRYGSAYIDKNSELMNISLDIRIEFKGDNVTEKKYINKILTGKRIIPYIVTKRNNEFDIISKLYEVKYFGLYKKLKWECTTKHRIRSEVSSKVFDENNKVVNELELGVKLGLLKPKE